MEPIGFLFTVVWISTGFTFLAVGASFAALIIATRRERKEEK